MNVELSYQELILCSTQAAMRQAQACRGGVVGSDHGSTSKRQVKQRLGDKILGEIGEKALAQALELPKTSSADPFGRGDVVDGLEVRATEHKGGHLLLYDSDPNARFFLAVVDFTPGEIRVSLPGWILASEGRKPEYKGDGDPPCYWVPQSALNPTN